MYAKKSNRRRTLSGKRLCAAFSTVAIAATTVGLAPATATVGPAGIAPGINITVFHNIDFIATFGWNVGDAVTVEVIRNGVAIGSAAGPAVDTPEGGGLEVNHGPAGIPQDGDCWTGHTPDVRPGDLIRVSGAGTVSEVLVDDINLTGAPTEDLLTGDVVVTGFARTANGTPIPTTELDSSEFRLDSDYRGGPQVVQSTGPNGEFEMRYQAPYELVGGRNRNNLNEAQKKAALLSTPAGHATGFGHTAPLPDEAMLVEGIGDAPGPALGCEASPSAQNAVTSANTANPGFVNAADVAAGGNLTIGGSSFDATSVDVTVGGLTETVTPSPSAGQQSWSVNFPMGDIGALADGDLSVSMVADGAVTGRPMTLTKDTGVPTVPTASPLPAASPFVGEVDVTLASTDSIRYTTDGSIPTATTGQLYSGPIHLTSNTTLKAIGVDNAMNASTAMSSDYQVVQATKPGAPAITNVRAGNASATVSWAAPAFNGHAAIEKYLLRVYRGASLVRTVDTGLDRRASVLRLANGSGYRFAVQAVNRVGNGALSARSSMVVPRTVASKPRQVRGNSGARGGRDTVTATWVAPTSNGGSAITSYVVRAQRVRANGSLARARVVAAKPARARSARLALRSGTYRFTVRAVNGIGNSPWSNLSNRAQSR